MTTREIAKIVMDEMQNFFDPYYIHDGGLEQMETLIKARLDTEINSQGMRVAILLTKEEITIPVIPPPPHEEVESFSNMISDLKSDLKSNIVCETDPREFKPVEGTEITEQVNNLARKLTEERIRAGHIPGTLDNQMMYQAHL